MAHLTPFNLAGSADASADGPTMVFIADGWTRRVFRNLLLTGQLPEITDGIIKPGGLVDVVSNLPTVSLASHTTILTATNQDEHGVVGHRWNDSANAIDRNYIGVSGPRQVNTDIDNNVSTVFDHFPLSFAVQSIITRGATSVTRLPTMRSGPILRKAGSLAVAHPQSLIVTWLPRGDALAHTFGPDSSQVANDMQETSRNMGLLLDQLTKAGLLEGSRILFVPDHGHRAVSKVASLKKLLASLGIASSVNKPARPGKNLVLTSGDSSALLYLDEVTRLERQYYAAQLAQKPEVEICCAFDGPDQVEFYSSYGHSIVKYLGPEAWYSTVDGSDPLGLSTVGSQTVFDMTAPMMAGKYPDFLHQIRHSFVDGRSGDLLLMAANGYHFGKAPRPAWRFGYHRGSHGGPFEDEILVSAAYRGLHSRLDERRQVRSADLLRVAGILPWREEPDVGCRAGPR